MLMQKLLLTGLLIFIKPNTTSQLAAGFVISAIFFVSHVRVAAYVREVEDDLQFCSMISITMTLFGGILLKTDTQDEDEYGSAVMTFLLLAINAGVICLFVYQTYKAVTEESGDSSPSLLDKAKQMLIDEVMAEARRRALWAVEQLGYAKAEAEALEAQLLDLVDNKIPVAMQTMEDCEEVLTNLRESLSSASGAMALVEKLLEMARNVLGEQEVVALMTPYTDAMVTTFRHQFDAQSQVLTLALTLALTLTLTLT